METWRKFKSDLSKLKNNLFKRNQLTDLDPRKYPVNRKNNHIGRCLIISNYIFDYGKNFPKETVMAELTALKKAFEKLKFDIIIRENLTLDEMRQELKAFAKMDHSDYSCSMVWISSHGHVVRNCEVVASTDGCMKVMDMYDLFSDENSPTLKGKPKAFVLDAGRGEDEQQLYISDADTLLIRPQQTSDNESNNSDDTISEEGSIISEYLSCEEDYTSSDEDEDKINYKKFKPNKPLSVYAKTIKNCMYDIPCQFFPVPGDDFVTVNSTIPGFMRYREGNNRSIFVSSFCKKLVKQRKQHDFVTIMGDVTVKVNRDTHPLKQQQVVTNCSLLKDWHLF